MVVRPRWANLYTPVPTKKIWKFGTNVTRVVEIAERIHHAEIGVAEHQATESEAAEDRGRRRPPEKYVEF